LVARESGCLGLIALITGSMGATLTAAPILVKIVNDIAQNQAIPRRGVSGCPKAARKMLQSRVVRP
jgi:hypothetical protein